MFEALFSPRLLLATLLFLLGVVLHEWLTRRGRDWFAEVPLNAWLFEHVGLPGVRAALLTLFVLLAYPLIFGQRELPALDLLLFTGSGRVSLLVFVALVLSLLLPLLPVVGQRHALVLPLQGIAIAALLFDWLGAHLGLTEVSLWPGLDGVLAILLLALLAPRLAGRIALRLGAWVDARFEVEESAPLLLDGVLLLMQLPVLLVYTLTLGEQLTAP